MFDLNDVAVFARVVEAGSFTGAARLLGIPKTTVSRRIAELESKVGIRLLQRTTRSLSMTDAGRLYYEESSRGLRAIEDANLRLADARAEPSGTICVSAPVAFGSFFLADTVFDFLAAYPKARVELRLTDDKLNLIEDGIDLAFRTGTLADSTLVARKLGSTHRIMCASPAYLELRGVPATVDDLSRHDCVIAGHSVAGAQWALEGPRGPETISVSGRIAANTMQLAFRAAIAGYGIALLPAATVVAATNEGRLQRVLKEYASAIGGFYAVYPSSRHLSPAVKAFVDLAAKRIGTADASWRDANED
jgi:DNA-binding transcriptional LysR family regulator